MISAKPRRLPGLARMTPPVWRILAHSMIFGLALSVADLLFNFYLVSLGYDAAVAGLLSTISRGAGMILGLPLGMLTDRIGPQRALIGGVLVYCTGWGLLLSSRELWALMVTQFLIGGSFLLSSTAVTPLLARVVTAEQRAASFGMNASAALIIGLVGSVVGGFLPGAAAWLIRVGPQDTAAYRTALISVIVLGVAALLPLLGRFPAAPAETPVRSGPAPVTTLPVRRLLRYALASPLLGVAGGMLLPFQNLFLRQQFGLSDAAVGVALAAVSLGMGLGALIGAPVSARLGLRRAAAYLRWGAMPAMLLMLIPAVIPATAGLILRGLFVAASFPMNDALMMHLTPERQRGFAVSLMGLSWSGGWAVSAVLSGWIQLHWGFTPVILITVVAYLLSGLAIITLPDELSSEHATA